MNSSKSRMLIIKLISTHLSVKETQVKSVIDLLIGGASIPFISRYRKEVTGSLDEVQLADIDEMYKKMNLIEKRKESIL